jgi:two-component system response regulator MprA
MAGGVLVVDNDPAIRNAVETAVDGSDAVARLDGATPVLVIADLNMPRLDGFEPEAELRRRGLRPRVKLLVMTARGSARADRRRTGADGYLLKPFGLRALCDEVARLIGDPPPA